MDKDWKLTTYTHHAHHDARNIQATWTNAESLHTSHVSIPWRASPSALHHGEPAELRKVSGTVGPLCHKATWNHGPGRAGRGMIMKKSSPGPTWENCWNMLKFHYHGHPKMDVQYSIPVPWRADFLVCQLSLFIVFVPHPHVPIVVGTWFTRVITQKNCFVLQVWWLAEGMSD